MRPAVSFDLHGTVMVNVVREGIAPRLRERLRTASGLLHLSADEADRAISDAMSEMFRGWIARGEHVEAYDRDGAYAEVCRLYGGEPLDPCTADAVVVDLHEAAEALMEHLLPVGGGR